VGFCPGFSIFWNERSSAAFVSSREGSPRYNIIFCCVKATVPGLFLLRVCKQPHRCPCTRERRR
jgi:hypothetical protein